MKAKEMFFEFLDTVFTSFVIAFIVFYFIVGRHWDVAEFIVKALTPFSVFSLIFIVKFKLGKRRMKKMAVEARLDEPCFYLSKSDRLKDRLVIAGLFFVLLAVPFFDNSFNAVDLWQGLLVLFIYSFWHIFLFKGEEGDDLIPVTYFDQLKDEAVIFFTPVAVLAVSLLARDTSWLDVIQAIIAAGVMYIWHRHLFNKL